VLIHIDGDEVGIVLSTIGPDSDWRVRAAVAEALAQNLGERSAVLLLPMLKDADLRVVAAVLGALPKARGNDALPTLLEYVQHSDAGIRSAVVEGLAALDKEEKPSPVTAWSAAYQASIDDSDVGTRLAVVDALS